MLLVLSPPGPLECAPDVVTSLVYKALPVQRGSGQVFDFCVVFRCLFDSQLTGSSSQFLPQSTDDRLQFELEAFRFQQDDRGVVRLPVYLLEMNCC